jgi:hypothetical protein
VVVTELKVSAVLLRACLSKWASAMYGLLVSLAGARAFLEVS